MRDRLELLRVKKLFLVGCFSPKWHSVGDHAQTLAVQTFLADHFPDYQVRRFYREEVDEFFKCDVQPDNLIFVLGSGGFGDISPSNWQVTRKKIVSMFPHNRIVQLPVTVFYHNPATFEADKIFYNDRPNLLILTRTRHGAELLRANLTCHVQFFPDFTFYLTPEASNTSRSGVLAVLRRDIESQFKLPIVDKLIRKTFRLSNLVGYITRKICLELIYRPHWFLKHHALKHRLQKEYGSVTMRDLQVSNVDLTDINREAYVQQIFREYQKYQLVVTDRFHAGVFAMLTGTPFISLPAYIRHKLDGTTDAAGNYAEYFRQFRRLVFTFNKKEESSDPSPLVPSITPNCLLHLIQSRRSIRQWTRDKPVDEKLLAQVLAAGAYAPTACNTQATHFRLISSPKDRAFVCGHTSIWFRSSVPAAIILVLYDTEKATRCGLNMDGWHSRFMWQDAACASMNMMLMAEGLGLKTCWASFSPKQQKQIQAYFKLGKVVVTNAVLLGYSRQQVNVWGAVHQGRPIWRGEKK